MVYSQAMVNSVQQNSGTPRERIMTVASELFYKQGYRATGINEVIEKSGVAKATFYNHFPSKDDLVHAYLVGVVDSELGSLDNELRKTRGPLNRFLLAINWLQPWLESTQFRGCAARLGRAGQRSFPRRVGPGTGTGGSCPRHCRVRTRGSLPRAFRFRWVGSRHHHT